MQRGRWKEKYEVHEYELQWYISMNAFSYIE
jgi:hypothetical protein